MVSAMNGNARWQPRNIYWNGWRTSARLEPEFWDALAEVARHHGMPLGELAAQINADRQPDEALSSAIRVFVLTHYRRASARHSNG